MSQTAVFRSYWEGASKYIVLSGMGSKSAPFSIAKTEYSDGRSGTQDLCTSHL